MKTPKLFSRDSETATVIGNDIAGYTGKDLDLEVGTMVYLPVSMVDFSEINLRSFQWKDEKIEHLTSTLYPDDDAVSSTKNQKSAIKVYKKDGKIFNLDGGHRLKILSDYQEKLIARMLVDFDKSRHTVEELAQAEGEARLSSPAIFIRCEVVLEPQDIVKEQFLSNISIKTKAGDIASYIKDRLNKGESSVQIAADLKFANPNKIFELVKLTKLPPEILEKVNSGALPVTSAIKISDEYAHNKGIRSPEQLKSIVDKVIGEKLPIEKVAEILTVERDSWKMKPVPVEEQTFVEPKPIKDLQRLEIVYAQWKNRFEMGQITEDNETLNTLHFVFGVDIETIAEKRAAWEKNQKEKLDKKKASEEKKEKALQAKAQEATDKGLNLETGESL
jgi:hypothetical protein